MNPHPRKARRSGSGIEGCLHHTEPGVRSHPQAAVLVRQAAAAEFWGKPVTDRERVEAVPARRGGSDGKAHEERRTEVAPRRQRASDDADAFGARSLRPLALLEGHRLAFAELVEPRALTGRIVEEVLVAVVRQNEPETLVTDEPLDRAVRCCHVRP